MILLPKENSW